MPFNDELLFESEFVKLLTESCGWEKQIIKNPTEEDLISNWKQILFENNKKKDVLNNCPLTDSEMNQIIVEINQLKSPAALNSFINGKTVSITRDNPDDELHFGKDVSLKIYDREEIAGGMSRYQVVEQPQFKTNNNVYPERRGDVMLLINGMPVFHIELKKTGVPITQAEVQIEKYMTNGCFSGIFSLIQIFVAMNPEDCVYYANPGFNGKFNPDFYFHWEDYNNTIVNEWDVFTKTVLSIPRAHEMIGYYTIADGTDGVLKVLRSYQYFAAANIASKVAKTEWTKAEQKGGFIWHTTGSGKTMTSFKSAQLIANSKDADKVVFLIDRIELGTQSFENYKNFANDDESVQDTEDTDALITKLKSDKVDDTLIITSIQKMSRITEDGSVNLNDLEKIRAKRIVFIIDECHRDQKGEMHLAVKKTFPRAIYFGFTGTPDYYSKMDENGHMKSYTEELFGDELHRYTIPYGIRDKNVLGFDPYRIPTYADDDLKEKVICKKLGCKDVQDIYDHGQKYIDAFNDLMNDMNMIDVEKEVTVATYQEPVHQQAVVKNILDKWIIRSHNNLFHALFATSSIPEAIEYYEEFKRQKPEFKVVALFDPSDNNGNTSIFKMNGITKMLTDYKEMFGNEYTHATYPDYKKDVCARLAHKKPYLNIKEKDQINLVIVVDQLLTGFDSKWVNTLYLDKVLEGKNLVQAISRTNRLYGKEKPHGTICWYRYTNTMEKNLYDAIDQYSGQNSLGIFVNKLGVNLKNMNGKFMEIKEHFENAGINNFSKNDDDIAWKKKFAKLFSQFNHYLESARIQGFVWERLIYQADELGPNENEPIAVLIDEITYSTLIKRYKELFIGSGGTNPGLPIDIDTNIMTVATDDIDNEYVNKKFKLYLKQLDNGDVDSCEKALKDLHNSFASLSQFDQKFAKLILQDIESGNFASDENKTFRDYLTDYECKAYNDQIKKFSSNIGISEERLRALMEKHPSADTINGFGEYNKLIETLDIDIALKYFENKYRKQITKRAAKLEADKHIRRFIIEGGYDIDEI